ncbi:MAG: class I SAM-dependent methyltransferase [Planctomycetota bacterium]
MLITETTHLRHRSSRIRRERRPAIDYAVDAFIDYLDLLGELDDATFDSGLHARLRGLDRLASVGFRDVNDVRRRFFERVGPKLDVSSVLRHGRRKPFGYAGDFLSIDWIYTRKHSEDRAGWRWDRFYHRQDAPVAVRARKAMFGRHLSEVVGAGPDDVAVLNVACGPGREVLDGLEPYRDSARSISVDCVDADEAALEYAQGLNGELQSSFDLRFLHANAFRFRAERNYDFVWCAGLYDYLNEKMARVLTRRLLRFVEPGGRLVIGNFHRAHRTRRYIEWCGDWNLVHRDERELLSVATDARAGIEDVRFERDVTGAVVLMVVEKGVKKP